LLEYSGVSTLTKDIGQPLAFAMTIATSSIVTSRYHNT